MCEVHGQGPSCWLEQEQGPRVDSPSSLWQLQAGTLGSAEGAAEALAGAAKAAPSTPSLGLAAAARKPADQGDNEAERCWVSSQAQHTQ